MGADLPRVLRLSLRLCESEVAAVGGQVGWAGVFAVSVKGWAGWAGVAALAVRGVRFKVREGPVGFGRLGRNLPGGSSGGGVSPPSC